MTETSEKGLEDILFEEGKIPSDKLSLVKLETINTGRPIEQIILEHGFANEQDLVQARAQLLGIPYTTIKDKAITSEVLGMVPEPVARRYILIPLEYKKDENAISVAMADPLDLQVIEFIERKAKARVKPYLASASEINDAIEDQYKRSLTTEVTAALEETTGMVEAQEAIADLGKLEEVIKEAPVAKIVSTLLEYAMKSRATDIHIEPWEDRTKVRYRVDGILHERVVLPKKIHESLVSRIKILSNLKIDEKRLPQDGRFTFKLGDKMVDLRIATLPTVLGEKIVMRLLPKAAAAPTLPELGLRGAALKVLQDNIVRPHGIIIVCGPTGSGKTTTLFSVLSKINSTRINILTLEDPVEYQIPGVNQVQINPTAGLTFATGLRSFLRHDPNVIMVGEIRDQETTDLAIQAALTGHLVFSTLHTNDAAGSIPRLIDLGAETFLLASSLNSLVGQRVVRRICDDCKTSYTAPESVVTDIKEVLGKLSEKDTKVKGKIKLYKGKGCSTCGDSGYLGRIAIFEVLPVSEKIGRLVLERASADNIAKAAAEAGMVTMLEDGYLKALEGITTLEEVLRVSMD
ncbi:MAG: hypothetical protein A2Y57_04030 [Candidatus Woykebacteria bacterium RBG_13_40_7b]|uniref:AAA+ ATPase domain-containing protein n=1 Tax=Candidatus Woykebacteria bacterium RBG_13_40_7b TaxID=1802594 RepID=A0A1G1W8G6_9BACT|nr:MAG: hypothetical protein A2Y57_04030 [Candidatus Woykebacteria bacterium RBG_13_40_7b]